MSEQQSRRRRGLAIAGGVTGGMAVGMALAIGVPRYLARRTRLASNDPYAHEPFELPPTSSVRTVDTRDGVAVHVETVGPDDADLTVVFAHGYMQDMATFYFLRKAIAEAGHRGASLRAVLYDQPGHGRSGPLPRTEYGIDDLAEVLHDVLEAVAPQGPLVLVGHSMGGMTLQVYARVHPEAFRERVQGVVFLSSSAAGLDTVETRPMRALRRLRRTVLPMLQQVAGWTPDLIDRSRLLAGDLAWLLTRRAAFGHVDPPASLVSLVERMNRRASIQSIVGYARAILDHDETATLPLFEGLPALVVVGDVDLLTPPEHSRRLAAALGGSRFELIAEAAHSPQLEYPGEISQLLLEMIDKVVAEIGKGPAAPAASAPPQRDPARQSRWSPFSRHHGHRLEP
ncbi:alpha/beta hydrolase [Glycomyces sp. TRM65418]|uniref:alpha/beta fold hydrolase n=1 Tax=Glycomyces sp. TRM65418 TaxID=2867006 RepID=UPI001CE5C2CD|nr:alpha/beta hydrolase [Glycomyces sp. TRM65418]MCC3764169.1 alpha/beta hydrolase [Glycomyces sp. TRM65418]QZD53854.1 alpha/beta hydrolase [Glycomyces sp. TRM65418]